MKFPRFWKLGYGAWEAPCAIIAVVKDTQNVANGLRFSPRAKVVTIAIIALAAVVFVFAIRGILAPFVWAAIVAYVFNPVVGWISKKARIHRFWAVALLYAMVGGAMIWVVMYVAPSLRRETEQFQHDLPSLISGLMTYLVGSDSTNILGYNVSSQAIVAELTKSSNGIASYVGGYAIPAVFSAIHILTKLMMFMFASFYALLDADRIGTTLRQAIPPAARDEITDLGASIDHVLGRWVRGQLLLLVIMSAATWVALSLLGVKYALVLALLTGVLELFPLVGPVIAGAIACGVALFQPNQFGWNSQTFVAAIAALYTVLRYAEDYFIIPNVIGRAVRFHPLVVFFALFAGGSIAGMLGMFIAVPTLAILKNVMGYLYAKIVEEPEQIPAAGPTKEPAPAEAPVANSLLTFRAQPNPSGEGE